MCRSIKTLRRADAPATDEELHAAALQFVRKISGYRTPSQANESAFNRAVDEIASTSKALLGSLKTRAAPAGR
jgi:hypothetical protein